MTMRTLPAKPGTPCWLDLGTTDMATSIAFYSELFGWRAQDQGEAFSHYHVFFLDDDMVAGAMTMPPGTRNGWTVFLASEDAAATETAIRAAHGTVTFSPIPVGPLGTMMHAADPAGAGFGVWQADQHFGTALPGDGRPVWWENYSTNFRASTEFYAAVFGVSYAMLSDTDDFRYAQIQVDGEVVGGLMDREQSMPEGQSSYWQAYIGVADVDAAAARVPYLGGTVLQEPMDSPYGRLTYCLDATGASFVMMTVAESSDPTT